MSLVPHSSRSSLLETIREHLAPLQLGDALLQELAYTFAEQGRAGLQNVQALVSDWANTPADYEGRLAHARDNPLWNAERRTPANSISVSANGQITSESSEPPAKRQKIISSSIQETSSTMDQAQTVKDQPVVEPYSFLPFVKPDYFTVRLPYSNRYGVPALTDGSDTGARNIYVKRFNLNAQIVDPTLTTYVYNGWDHYGSSGMNYTYYRILYNTVKVRVWHIGAGSAIRVMFGEEQNSRNVLADPERWNEIPGYTIKDIIKGQADNSAKWVDYTYTYNPNQRRKDVRAFESSSTTNNVEGWTALGSSPNLLDQLVIRMGSMRIKQAGAATNITATGSGDIQYDITITSTVQFRDSNAISATDIVPDAVTQVTDTTAIVTTG